MTNVQWNRFLSQNKNKWLQDTGTVFNADDTVTSRVKVFLTHSRRGKPDTMVIFGPSYREDLRALRGEDRISYEGQVDWRSERNLIVLRSARRFRSLGEN